MTVVSSQVWSGMPRFCHPWISNQKSYPFRLHNCEEIHGQSPLVAICGFLPILRTSSNIQLVHQNPINGDSRKLRNRNAGIIQRDPPIFTHDFLSFRDCLIASWWSPALVFVINFSVTKCKLPTPLLDVFDIHAWFAIHFCQLMIHFFFFFFPRSKT